MSVRFSTRTSWHLSENRITERARALRAEGKVIADLTESNPTRVGLAGPLALASLLDAPGADRYQPEPLGLASARAAIAQDRSSTQQLDPSRMVLSASTSEAYTWLFKLLAEPGDEVLVPAPSYPLFTFLADVEAVRLVSYPLIRDEGFRIDLAALERAITPRTRAVIVVHPNNPTGTFTRKDDAQALDAVAASRGMAVISDEVFGDYAIHTLPSSKLATFATDGEALTFVLSGLSKVVCAPQLKLAWTSVHGPADDVRRAMERLEVIADTFLSVSTPVQLALPEMLGRRRAIQEEVRERISANLGRLDRIIADLGPEAPVRRLAMDGGWSAIIEVPRTRSDDEWVELLLDEKILVHPGYFFDMDREGFLVLSLLTETETFAAAAERVVRLAADG